MIALPKVVPTAVMAKDLRLRMRGWRWAGVVTLYVGVLAVVALSFLLQRYNPAVNQPFAGIRLFQSLAFFQLLLLLFITPASVAGAISGERQQRTWELLMAARMPAREIVWGKLLAGIAFNLVLIGASLPIFALVFLFGGLTPGDMVPAFAVFLATVLLLGSTSLLISALTSRLTVSYMLSMFVALTLTIGISLLALYLQAPRRPGLLTLGSIPFQSFNSPASLTPLVQLDPLVALLSALPAEGGGTILGPLGTVHHPFGLPGHMPLWGTFTLVSLVVSVLLTLATTWLIRHPLALHFARAGQGSPASGLTGSRHMPNSQADGGTP